MRTRILAAATVIGLGLTGHVYALDVCDALGLSGLTISSDTNCLQITGDVRYEFRWGDYRGEPCVTGANRPADDDDIDDPLGLSGLTISSDTNCLQISGEVRYEFNWGDGSRGLLETGSPGGVVMPALQVPYYSRGWSAKGTIGYSSDDLPFNLQGLFEADSQSGSGAVSNLPFVNGLGVPNVGNHIGAFTGAPTDVVSGLFDFTRNGYQIGPELSFPIVTSVGEGHNWTIGGRAGGFFGGFEQIDRTRFTTSTGGAPSTIAYDTTFRGAGGGVYVGLDLLKTMDLGDDMVLALGGSATLGYKQYRVDIRDSVAASGVLTTTGTNAFAVDLGTPTGALAATVALIKGSLALSLEAGVTYGENPYIDYSRIISNQTGTPWGGFNPGVGGYVAIGLHGAIGAPPPPP